MLYFMECITLKLKNSKKCSRHLQQQEQD